VPSIHQFHVSITSGRNVKKRLRGISGGESGGKIACANDFFASTCAVQENVAGLLSGFLIKLFVLARAGAMMCLRSSSPPGLGICEWVAQRVSLGSLSCLLRRNNKIQQADDTRDLREQRNVCRPELFASLTPKAPSTSWECEK
jgi:hypothetical protein